MGDKIKLKCDIWEEAFDSNPLYLLAEKGGRRKHYVNK